MDPTKGKVLFSQALLIKLPVFYLRHYFLNIEKQAFLVPLKRDHELGSSVETSTALTSRV